MTVFDVSVELLRANRRLECQLVVIKMLSKQNTLSGSGLSDRGGFFFSVPRLEKKSTPPSSLRESAEIPP